MFQAIMGFVSEWLYCIVIEHLSMNSSKYKGHVQVEALQLNSYKLSVETPKNLIIRFF